MGSELACTMCGAGAPEHLFTSANGYAIVRCRACSFAFTDAREAPPAAELYPAFDQSAGFAQQSARSAVSVFLRQRGGGRAGV